MLRDFSYVISLTFSHYVFSIFFFCNTIRWMLEPPDYSLTVSLFPHCNPVVHFLTLSSNFFIISKFSYQNYCYQEFCCCCCSQKVLFSFHDTWSLPISARSISFICNLFYYLYSSNFFSCLFLCVLWSHFFVLKVYHKYLVVFYCPTNFNRNKAIWTPFHMGQARD